MKFAEITLPEKDIRYIKRKGFGFIKVELEAQLNRQRHESDNEADDCIHCDSDGDVECDHDTNCESCGGDGYRECEEDHEHHPRGVVVPNECFMTYSERSVLQCEDCRGEGSFDCEESHSCEVCDGNGWIANPEAKAPMTDHFCRMWILNKVSREAREAVVYSQFYYDGSVDSEFTFTLPIEASVYLPEFLTAFKSLSELSGYMDEDRAGMHIAILRDSFYPCSTPLDPAKLTNFKREVKKLLPALFFLASGDHRSRELNFRYPQIANDKYSAIHLMNGAMEYRVFQTCYDRPEMILQFISVIAKTLKFYGTSVIKREMFKSFDFPETTNRKQAYLARFYRTPEQMRALDLGLKYLAPDGTTADLLKAQRHFKPNFNKLYEEVQLRKRYIAYVAQGREYAESSIKERLRENLASINPRIKRHARLYNLSMDPDKLKAYRKELEREYRYTPPSFESWRRSVASDRPAVTITL